MVIRACGGVTQAEDRLNAATRWTAEKTGLAGAKDTLDTKVRPPMAAATKSLTEAIYGGASATMDSAESAADGFAGWVVHLVGGAFTSVEASLRSVLNPNGVEEPKPQDDTEGKNRPPSRPR
jgi:hypothetical protein